MAGGPAVLELLSGGGCVHADSCPGGTSFVSHAIGCNTTNRIRLCDPALVRYRHGVGYRRSPGNMTSRRLAQSAEVVYRRGQRWWSVLSSWPSPTQAHGSRLVGHSSTTTTETIYRKQICPVIVHGADIMHGSSPAGPITMLSYSPSTVSPSTEDHIPSELVGVAGFEPAASSSRRQHSVSPSTSALATAWGGRCVAIHLRPSESAPVVTHLVAQRGPGDTPGDPACGSMGCHAHPLPAHLAADLQDATHWCTVGGNVERLRASKAARPPGYKTVITFPFAVGWFSPGWNKAGHPLPCGSLSNVSDLRFLISTLLIVSGILLQRCALIVPPLAPSLHLHDDRPSPRQAPG